MYAKATATMIATFAAANGTAATSNAASIHARTALTSEACDAFAQTVP